MCLGVSRRESNGRNEGGTKRVAAAGIQGTTEQQRTRAEGSVCCVLLLSLSLCTREQDGQSSRQVAAETTVSAAHAAAARAFFSFFPHPSLRSFLLSCNEDSVDVSVLLVKPITEDVNARACVQGLH